MWVQYWPSVWWQFIISLAAGQVNWWLLCKELAQIQLKQETTDKLMTCNESIRTIYIYIYVSSPIIAEFNFLSKVPVMFSLSSVQFTTTSHVSLLCVTLVFIGYLLCNMPSVSAWFWIFSVSLVESTILLLSLKSHWLGLPGVLELLRTFSSTLASPSCNTLLANLFIAWCNCSSLGESLTKLYRVLQSWINSSYKILNNTQLLGNHYNKYNTMVCGKDCVELTEEMIIMNHDSGS